MVMLSRYEHPENVLSLICITPSGMIKLVRPVHPENADLPICVTPSGTVKEVRPVQLENANSPMVSSLDWEPKLISLSPALEKAQSPMLVTESGISMLSSLEQIANVPSPIALIPEGRTIPDRELQLRKASTPMLSTVSGILMVERLVQP